MKTFEIYKRNNEGFKDIIWYKGYDFTALLNRMDGRTKIEIDGYGEIKVSEARKLEQFKNLTNVDLMTVRHSSTGAIYNIKQYRNDLFEWRANYYFGGNN